MPSQLPQISAPATTVKKTKYYARFLNRLAHFEGDVELVDVFRSAVYGGRLSRPSGGFLLEHVRPERHPRLAAREANQHNRTIAVTHLKRTVHASFIKDLYEDFAEYMTSLLAGAARRLFRRLEEEAKKSGVAKLLSSLDVKLGLGVGEEVRRAALPYLELRHRLVHADGIADEKFCKNYPEMSATAGEPIQLKYERIVSARDAVEGLIRKFDECAVQKSIVPKEDLEGMASAARPLRLRCKWVPRGRTVA
ncbi:MAG: hypothetical protein H0T76_16595 [Nannocystis sp.]|nr:hypothetical protein [Nannocystis sp.]MBA3548102.1 hypothetical protein [Nannocystis sp.]